MQQQIQTAYLRCTHFHCTHFRWTHPHWTALHSKRAVPSIQQEPFPSCFSPARSSLPTRCSAGLEEVSSVYQACHLAFAVTLQAQRSLEEACSSAEHAAMQLAKPSPRAALRHKVDLCLPYQRSSHRRLPFRDLLEPRKQSTLIHPQPSEPLRVLAGRMSNRIDDVRFRQARYDDLETLLDHPIARETRAHHHDAIALGPPFGRSKARLRPASPFDRCDDHWGTDEAEIAPPLNRVC